MRQGLCENNYTRSKIFRKIWEALIEIRTLALLSNIDPLNETYYYLFTKDFWQGFNCEWKAASSISVPPFSFEKVPHINYLNGTIHNCAVNKRKKNYYSSIQCKLPFLYIKGIHTNAPLWFNWAAAYEIMGGLYCLFFSFNLKRVIKEWHFQLCSYNKNYTK